MNIGVDIRVLMSRDRTGVGEYTFELLNALFLLDQQNDYWLFYNSYSDVARNIPKWNQKNVHFVATTYPNKLFNASLLFFRRPYLDKLIAKKINKDLDIFFSPNINFTAVSSKPKFILTVHDLSFEFFQNCFSAKQRMWHKIINPKKQCRRADLILTPSDNTRRDVMKEYGIDEKKVKRVYPGLSGLFGSNETRLRQGFGGQSGRGGRSKYILYLGTIEPRKNVVGIIEAFKESGLFAEGFELIIAGAKGWGFKQIEDLIKKTKGVKYIGYVDSTDKISLYKNASLFVYPSLYEGFGFPVLEAMASGAPVITSNRSSLPEVAGQGAYLVNPYNISDIAFGMKLLLENTAIANMYKERGLEQIKKFSWEATAKEFLHMINEIK